MGIIFNGKNSDDFGVCIKTISIPILPPKRQKVITVQGVDGGYVFEDGYDNIKIELKFTIANEEIIKRRKIAREIALWLSSTGILILGYESDIQYNVLKTSNDISASMDRETYRDEFTVIFECAPNPEQTYYNDSLTWDEADGFWDYVNIPFEGYERIFDVSPGQSIEIFNDGTYKAFPVIKISGVGSSITVGSFTISNLNGTIYVDCKKQVVYEIVGDSKINRMSDFSGNRITLVPGSNVLSISGSFTTVNIEFDYKNTYL